MGDRKGVRAETRYLLVGGINQERDLHNAERVLLKYRRNKTRRPVSV